MQRELSREELRWLYAASDAFVLPTRGEGWCLPAMEAMSMALPVILTNASGTTEYLTRKNSLPLGFTRTHADGKVSAANHLQLHCTDSFVLRDATIHHLSATVA